MSTIRTGSRGVIANYSEDQPRDDQGRWAGDASEVEAHGPVPLTREQHIEMARQKKALSEKLELRHGGMVHPEAAKWRQEARQHEDQARFMTPQEAASGISAGTVAPSTPTPPTSRWGKIKKAIGGGAKKFALDVAKDLPVGAASGVLYEAVAHLITHTQEKQMDNAQFLRTGSHRVDVTITNADLDKPPKEQAQQEQKSDPDGKQADPQYDPVRDAKQTQEGAEAAATDARKAVDRVQAIKDAKEKRGEATNRSQVAFKAQPNTKRGKMLHQMANMAHTDAKEHFSKISKQASGHDLQSRANAKTMADEHEAMAARHEAIAGGKPDPSNLFNRDPMSKNSFVDNRLGSRSGSIVVEVTTQAQPSEPEKTLGDGADCGTAQEKAESDHRFDKFITDKDPVAKKKFPQGTKKSQKPTKGSVLAR